MQAKNLTPEQYKEQGNAYFSKKNWQQAINCYELALQQPDLNPKTAAMAWENIAICYHKMDQKLNQRAWEFYAHAQAYFYDKTYKKAVLGLENELKLLGLPNLLAVEKENFNSPDLLQNEIEKYMAEYRFDKKRNASIILNTQPTLLHTQTISVKNVRGVLKTLLETALKKITIETPLERSEILEFILGQYLQHSSIEAAIQIGIWHHNGEHGLSKDADLGRRYWQSAVVQSAAKTSQYLFEELLETDAKSQLYFHVLKLIPNTVHLRFELFTIGTESGCLEMQCYLGTCYLEGVGVEKNYILGEKYLRDAAIKGNYNAQITLGSFYQKYMLPEYYKNSHAYYGRNAYQYLSKETTANSFYFFARMLILYDDGNTNLSLQILEKAAHENHPFALLELADAYFYSAELENHFSKSFEFTKRAAEQGIPLSQYELGISYSHGLGIEENKNLAKQYYQKAKEQGHPLATMRLALEEKKINIDKTREEFFISFLKFIRYNLSEVSLQKSYINEPLLRELAKSRFWGKNNWDVQFIDALSVLQNYESIELMLEQCDRILAVSKPDKSSLRLRCYELCFRAYLRATQNGLLLLLESKDNWELRFPEVYSLMEKFKKFLKEYEIDKAEILDEEEILPRIQNYIQSYQLVAKIYDDLIQVNPQGTFLEYKTQGNDLYKSYKSKDSNTRTQQEFNLIILHYAFALTKKPGSNIDQEQAIVWKNISLCHRENDSSRKALYAASQAYFLDKSNPNVIYELGSVLLLMNQYDLAKKVIISYKKENDVKAGPVRANAFSQFTEKVMAKQATHDNNKTLGLLLEEYLFENSLDALRRLKNQFKVEEKKFSILYEERSNPSISKNADDTKDLIEHLKKTNKAKSQDSELAQQLGLINMETQSKAQKLENSWKFYQVHAQKWQMKKKWEIALLWHYLSLSDTNSPDLNAPIWQDIAKCHRKLQQKSKGLFAASQAYFINSSDKNTTLELLYILEDMNQITLCELIIQNQPSLSLTEIQNSIEKKAAIYKYTIEEANTNIVIIAKVLESYILYQCCIAAKILASWFLEGTQGFVEDPTTAKKLKSWAITNASPQEQSPIFEILALEQCPEKKQIYIKYFKKVADKHPNAALCLGKFYSANEFMDLDQSIHYYNKVLEKGAKAPHFYLGQAFMKKENFDLATKHFMLVDYLLDPNEYVEAQFELASIFHKKGDLSEELHHIAIAVVYGYKPAQNRYVEIQAHTVDEAFNRKYGHRADFKLNSEANILYHCALHFLNYDKRAAHTLFRVAYYRGSPEAAAYLGAYTTSPDEAFQCYKFAAKQRVPRGLLGLAVCHWDGTGVPQNTDKAISYYESAMKKNDLLASVSLGLRLLKVGDEKSFNLGLEYLEIGVITYPDLVIPNLLSISGTWSEILEDRFQAEKFYKAGKNQGVPTAEIKLCSLENKKPAAFDEAFKNYATYKIKRKLTRKEFRKKHPGIAKLNKKTKEPIFCSSGIAKLPDEDSLIFKELRDCALKIKGVEEWLAFLRNKLEVCKDNDKLFILETYDFCLQFSLTKLKDYISRFKDLATTKQELSRSPSPALQQKINIKLEEIKKILNFTEEIYPVYLEIKAKFTTTPEKEHMISESHAMLSDLYKAVFKEYEEAKYLFQVMGAKLEMSRTEYFLRRGREYAGEIDNVETILKLGYNITGKEKNKDNPGPHSKQYEILKESEKLIDELHVNSAAITFPYMDLAANLKNIGMKVLLHGNSAFKVWFEFLKPKAWLLDPELLNDKVDICASAPKDIKALQNLGYTQNPNSPYIWCLDESKNKGKPVYLFFPLKDKDSKTIQALLESNWGYFTISKLAVDYKGKLIHDNSEIGMQAVKDFHSGTLRLLPSQKLNARIAIAAFELKTAGFSNLHYKLERAIKNWIPESDEENLNSVRKTLYAMFGQKKQESAKKFAAILLNEKSFLEKLLGRSFGSVEELLAFKIPISRFIATPAEAPKKKLSVSDVSMHKPIKLQKIKPTKIQEDQQNKDPEPNLPTPLVQTAVAIDASFKPDPPLFSKQTNILCPIILDVANLLKVKKIYLTGSHALELIDCVKNNAFLSYPKKNISFWIDIQCLNQEQLQDNRLKKISKYCYQISDCQTNKNVKLYTFSDSIRGETTIGRIAVLFELENNTAIAKATLKATHQEKAHLRNSRLIPRSPEGENITIEDRIIADPCYIFRHCKEGLKGFSFTNLNQVVLNATITEEVLSQHFDNMLKTHQREISDYGDIYLQSLEQYTLAKQFFQFCEKKGFDKKGRAIQPNPSVTTNSVFTPKTSLGRNTEQATKQQTDQNTKEAPQRKDQPGM
jgi:TPR repeat protein